MADSQKKQQIYDGNHPEIFSDRDERFSTYIKVFLSFVRIYQEAGEKRAVKYLMHYYDLAFDKENYIRELRHTSNSGLMFVGDVPSKPKLLLMDWIDSEGWNSSEEVPEEKEIEKEENDNMHLYDLFNDVLSPDYIDSEYKGWFVEALTNRFIPGGNQIIFKKGARYLLELIDRCIDQKYLVLVDEDMFDYIIRNFKPDKGRHGVIKDSYNRKNLTTEYKKTLGHNPISDYFDKLDDPFNLP